MGMLVVNSDYERLYGKKKLDYLCFDFVEYDYTDITFKFSINSNPNITSVSYSVNDGENWITIDNFSSNQEIGIHPISGLKVLFKGEAISYNDSQFKLLGIDYNNKDVVCNVSGNIMSLLYNDDFENKLEFPEGSTSTFSGLFGGGWSRNMSFDGIKLPATRLAKDCYNGMFYAAINMITAPELPATILPERCYRYMFAGCSKLNSVKMMGISLDGEATAFQVFDSWLRDVSENGVIIKSKDSQIEFPTGASGIPTGWTVEEI